ncbi:MAG: hydroxymethylbilane synthase [Firmicutes bacterium]|nr:hydroxymethylbilane synthase [Bacillota bacterium]
MTHSDRNAQDRGSGPAVHEGRKRLVVGTRDSQLALWQTKWVIGVLKAAHPDLEVEIRQIKTKGDKILDTPLPAIGDKGLFVKEIEHALAAGEIDLAVHSMKDVPTEIPPGLAIAGMSRRADPRDVLISRSVKSVVELPKGALIGTSSLRRIAQLKYLRPDLAFEPIRGNLDTRLRKLDGLKLSAIVLAAAGLDRLEWEAPVVERISPEICLPAVGQGALGVEIRADDAWAGSLVESLRDLETETAVRAERAFLGELEGGCHVPIGALGEVSGARLRISGVVASLDGERLVRGEVAGPARDSEELGFRLAQQLRRQGAREILEELKQALNNG